MNDRRRGFVLLAVLWVIVALAALALALRLASRDAIGSATNRIALTRAAWAAKDCLARARAVIDADLQAPPTTDWRGLGGWNALGKVIAREPLMSTTRCSVSVQAAGVRLDVNRADHDMLDSLLRHDGASPTSADSLADAILDWRDADSVPRPEGAERAWYRSRHRFAPRDGELVDRDELQRVRGFDAVPGLDTLLDVEPGRIPVNLAPIPVLAAIPGVDDEVLARIAELRASATPIADLLAFVNSLPPDAQERIRSRYSEFSQWATVDPDAWLLTARGSIGIPRITVTLEVRVVRSGASAAIARIRRSPQ